VELRREDGTLRIQIADSGAGMDPDNAGTKSGLGLLNIQERVRLVGGKLHIRSSPGAGTTISVEVPETSGAAATSGVS